MSPAHHHRPFLAVLRRRLIAVTSTGGLLAVAIVACGHPANGPSPPGLTPAEPAAVGPTPMPLPVAPSAPLPVNDGLCDYLPATSVQTVNGERVAAVRVSGTAPDQPYPACFFYTGNGTIQLRSWIVVATPAVAHATVDAMVPVATSDLAELAGGWSGGSQPTADGAVFAVARHGTAVVITTNQRQTISARRIAEQVITSLRL